MAKRKPSPSSRNPEPQPLARRACVLVLGMHRSGTSALTRVISLLGAELPRHLVGPLIGNETGHWEPERLVELNDRMLAEGGTFSGDWRTFDIAALPAHRFAHLRDEAARIIAEEYGDAALFVIKDPRVSRCLPIYLAALQKLGVEPKPVHIVRNPLSVAASLEKRDLMTRGFSCLLWLRYNLDGEAATRGMQRVFVRYEDLMRDWRATAAKIAAGVGADLRLNPPAEDAIAGFLSPEHYHERHSDEEALWSTAAPEWVRDAFRAVPLFVADPASAPAAATFDRLRTQLIEAALSLGQPVANELGNRQQTMVGAYENTVGGLNTALAQRDARIAAIETLQSERGGRIGALEAVVAERGARIEAFEATSAARDSRLQALEATAAERTEKIASLEALLAERVGRIGALEIAIAERGARIASFEAGYAERGARIEAIEALSGERARRVESLEAANAESRARTQALEVLAGERAGRIEALEAANAESRANAESLEALAAARADEIAALEAANAASAAKARDLEAAVAEHLGAMQAIEATLAERRERVDAMDVALRGRDARIQGLESTLAERGERIDAMDVALRGRDARIQGLESALVQRERAANELATALGERRERVDALDVALRGRDARIYSSVTALAEREQRLGALETRLPDSEARVERMASRIENLQGLLTDARKRPLGLVRDRWSFRLLRLLAHSRLLTEAARNRFAQSAAKRDPKRDLTPAAWDT